MIAPSSKRKFVPKDLDCSDWSQIEPLYHELLNRDINSADELEKWLLEFSELSAVIDEYHARLYINQSCYTDDPMIEEAYIHFVENINPKIEELFFKFKIKYLECPYSNELTGKRYEILKHRWQSDVELFRDQNISIQTKEIKIRKEYDKLCGAMMPEFRGKQYTVQQLASFYEDQDRQTRKEAMLAVASRWSKDSEKVDKLFDELQVLRRKLATNADLPDYRAYKWKSMWRFDYSPLDCEQFANSVEKTCVPLIDKLYKKRARELDVDPLRPWDLNVYPGNRPPLRPFNPEKPEDLVYKTRKIINRISPTLEKEFGSLLPGKNLDLDSRKGKRPGGYQTSLEETQQPFIFMNAAGTHRNVMTLLHEFGHAFHFIESCRNEPLMFLRRPAIDFCEVASYSMELMGGEHFDVLYTQEDAARAYRNLLEEKVSILPWIAIIDSFQHWLYTHQDHSREERTEHWIKLLDRFESKQVDYSGYESYRETRWQRQIHLFNHPFYMIEYGIAILGALQLWMNYRKDPKVTLRDYRAVLSLGGTCPLPELFDIAGIKFDFSQSMMQKLMDIIEKELDELPN